MPFGIWEGHAYLELPHGQDGHVGEREEVRFAFTWATGSGIMGETDF
ncbi:MAG: hypothetical protein OXI24_20140 [Candidatus Poribacteria bacterium]|nr:hypothetical protein [Candidatus Poribacteria bacterium]